MCVVASYCIKEYNLKKKVKNKSGIGRLQYGYYFNAILNTLFFKANSIKGNTLKLNQ